MLFRKRQLTKSRARDCTRILYRERTHLFLAGSGQNVALRRVGQELAVACDEAITEESRRGGDDAIRGIAGRLAVENGDRTARILQTLLFQ